MCPSVLKIQYTELKLSCGNDPVVKNYIYSNGDLDLWPNDPKISRVLPLPQGNHVAKFGKVKIWYTELKLLCGNLCGRPPPAIPNHIIRPVSRKRLHMCEIVCWWRKCIFFYWFHHVFLILSVILTKYHYIILTDYPGIQFHRYIS
jgi:hypothetical protein